MKTLEGLAAYGMPVLAAIVFGLLMLSYLIGIGVGRWRQARTPETLEATSFVTSGLLGLLAFTLGLTIAMAQGRFEGRRAVTLSESNAIGTAWLRASAMDHPRAQEIARLLETYTRTRIDFVAAHAVTPAIAAAQAETVRLQNLLWGHAAAITREVANPITAALAASLNDVIDQSAAQRWAFEAPIPGELLGLLWCMTVLSMGFTGYKFGLTRVGEPALATLIVAVWSAALLLVVDLSTGRYGAVRPDPAPYLWALEGFRGGLVLPPAP